jgi:predicted acylesterase/phospholipase RssA
VEVCLSGETSEAAALRTVSMVLAGGVALGAYEAGAFAGLHGHATLRPTWLAGSSIGAVNAAIIAGFPPERQVEHLRRFWAMVIVKLAGHLDPEVRDSASYPAI